MTAAVEERSASTASQGWKRSGLPFLVMRVVGQACEFAAFVLLARHLAPAQFGRLSVVFLAARYVGLAADWGASARGARDLARGDASSVSALLRQRTRASAALCVAFAVGVGGLAGAPYAVLALVVLARGLNRDWLALGRERGMASGAASVVQGFVLAALALVAHSPGAAALAVAGGYLAGLVVSVAMNPRPSASDGSSPADASARADGWMLGATLADQVTTSADTFLLVALKSASAAGTYAAMYRLPSAWMTLVGLVALGMLAPTTRRLAGASIEEVKVMRSRAAAVGAKAALAIMASAIPACFVVPVLFGHAYDSGRAALLVLMAGTAVMTVGASLHPLYLALAKDRDVFTLSLGGAAVNVGVNAIAIPLWGMVGAAVATLLAQSFLVGLVVVRLRRLLP